MKKILSLILVTALGFAALSASASETNSLFNANELSLTASASTTLKSHELTSLNAGVGYFVTKNFGVEANVPVYRTQGTSIQNVNFGGVFRVPLFRHVAPFIRAGADYNWQSKDWLEYAGGGIEFRVNSKWGVFGDANYQIHGFNNYQHGTWFPRAGVRFVF